MSNVRTILDKLGAVAGNNNSSIMVDGTIGDSVSWSSTGSYLLNMQISGDMYKGLPNGQMLTLK